jgi:LmbE family N-acetylglucosaminyl deacetylase
MVARRILGMFAHPDDEVFCVGGTVAAAVDAGAEAMILSATRGEAGQIRDASAATRATLGAVREQELRDACSQLGVQHVRCLDHIDGTLAGIDRPSFVAELGAVVDEFDPDVVVTFGSDGAYGHPDHIAVSEATTEACLARPHVRVYHSHFARSRLLLLERLSAWLSELREQYAASSDFARVFSVFAQETTAVGYADDHINIGWFPPGVSIVEQGEASHHLYLVLSGEVDVVKEDEHGSRTVVGRAGPGEFFGELGVAHSAARAAHVIARDSVTCLIFSRRPDTLWAGRGDVSELAALTDPAAGPAGGPTPTTVIDVRAVVDRKVAALAAHRTQYPIEPEMFPRWLLEEMMGQEWFVRVQPAPELETSLFA